MKSLLSISALFGLATAHTIFQEVYVNGVDQGHINGIRVPSYDGPITDVTSNDLICNGGINPYQTPISQVIIDATAGAQVTAEWHHTLAGLDPSDSQDPIDPSHKGPVMAYLAQVPSALQNTTTGLSWFKIYEDGYSPSTGLWAVDTLITNKGKVTFTIPSCIPSGQYLMRVEIIALHAASTYPGAQFYMECAQLQISGGGSTTPSGVSFPGAYHTNDPGVVIDIYYPTVTSYTIPGPTVFSCGGSSSGSSTTLTSATTTPTTVSSSSTTTPTTVSSSSTKVTVSSSSASASSTATTTAAHYAQCGGIGWTGATVCASPYTCTVSSAYYSQCL